MDADAAATTAFVAPLETARGIMSRVAPDTEVIYTI
jgi:hypothetical protein